ncbi:MAG: hypothetical protein HYT89_05880 [Candidatus Omnitrophica bacterium]|nr:hypothetical protein [Candidatus Omnitrophota bacterium]
MKTQQLNARIDEKAYAVLAELTSKLHTTKAHLTEKAIYLLKEHFEKLEKSIGSDKTSDIFLSSLDKSLSQYDALYRKLAK